VTPDRAPGPAQGAPPLPHVAVRDRARPFDPGDRDQGLRDDRPRQRSIIAAGSSAKARPSAAHQVIARELVADVDDVGADGTGERAVADLLEPLLALPGSMVTAMISAR
jgi:hypothetical protein